jgi:hypothetical protein
MYVCQYLYEKLLWQKEKWLLCDGSVRVSFIMKEPEMVMEVKVKLNNRSLNNNRNLNDDNSLKY